MKEYTKPMLATGYEVSKVSFPCLIQPKFDGCRALLCLIGDGEAHLLSRTGKEYNVPHILKWANEHKELLPLDGELYCHEELTFQQICSAVKCYSPWTEMLKYVVYDRPVDTMTNISRMAWLNDNLRPALGNGVELSDTYMAFSVKDIDSWHEVFVSRGYEGAIVRNQDALYQEGRSDNLIKVKKFDTTEFEIIDVIEAGGKDAGTAIFRLKSGDYSFYARPVGPKELRSRYLCNKESLKGKKCTIQHFGYTDGGIIPRFPVALGIRDYE